MADSVNFVFNPHASKTEYNQYFSFVDGAFGILALGLIVELKR